MGYRLLHTTFIYGKLVASPTSSQGFPMVTPCYILLDYGHKMTLNLVNTSTVTNIAALTFAKLAS